MANAPSTATAQSAFTEEPSTNFRDYVIPLDHPRLHPRERGPREHAAGVLGDSSIFLTPVAQNWLRLYNEPYKGFTTDGHVRPNLYHHKPDPNGPTKDMVSAAEKLLRVAKDEEKAKFHHTSYDSQEWRSWSNPEVIVVDSGLRLEEMAPDTCAAVRELLRASTSEAGYKKLDAAMVMNGFLGEVTKLTNVMNKDSYHFNFFGTPSETEPWGFNLFGHHCCVNVFTLEGETQIGPFFVGAEPNIVDDGDNKGLVVLNREEEAGYNLMRSLPPELQAEATIQGSIFDIDGSTMPEGRWNPADLRGLGGAFQDNRIVPFEGLRASKLPKEKQKELLDIVRIFNELLPASSLERFMERVEAHIDETYFAWIGPVDDVSPFYFRIHSPVVMDEFDHHNGVWLSNVYPKRYHIHTVQRLPNRGDYGKALVEDWKRQKSSCDEGIVYDSML